MTAFRTVSYYSDVLATLRQGLPGPVHIAGGAVRDTILGVAIKDIDIRQFG
jgi:tRNA nucleotidyltransferase/poly(A) polymerase